MEVAVEFKGRFTTTSAGQVITGAVLSTMLTTTSSVSDPPPVFVTVRVIVCEPVGSDTIKVEPVPSDVAPSAHEYELILPVPGVDAVSYTHLRAHETPEHLVCRL